MFRRIKTYGSFVTFSHTIFALPFALTSMIFASTQVSFEWMTLLWILLAMAGARSAAMGFNRILDRHLDAENPRTKDRELPTGKISLLQAWIFVVVSSALFIFSAFKLNMLCFYLSPVALTVVFFYSFTKRFTWAAHLFLGLALGVAPVGAWLAITGSFALPPLIISAAVIFWVAGFDIIYSCQDIEFDTLQNLKSIPAVFGIQISLVLSAIMHLITVILLATMFFFFELGYFYFTGLLIVSVIFFYEHLIVKSSDLSRINKAFFDLNGYVSVLFLFFTALDIFSCF